MKFIRTIGQILESVEHETRMIRVAPSHPDNRPFYFLNAIGRGILRLTGDDRE